MRPNRVSCTLVARPAQRPAASSGVILVALVVAMLGLTAGCASTPSDSGIQGEVRIGPVSPVETPGTEANKPYSAELTIRPTAGGRSLRVTSGQDGRFRVALKPGTYVVEPRQGNPLPTAQPLTVHVKAHEFASVTIEYDSGIR